MRSFAHKISCKKLTSRISLPFDRVGNKKVPGTCEKWKIITRLRSVNEVANAHVSVTKDRLQPEKVCDGLFCKRFGYGHLILSMWFVFGMHIVRNAAYLFTAVNRAACMH